MSPRRFGFARVACVLLAVLAGCLLLAVSSAWAGQTRLLTGVFGVEASPTDPYPLLSGSAVAVDSETHDVYVADPAGNRVEKFDSAGHFILMIGKDVDRTTGGNVCTAASGDVCQAGVAGASPGAFESGYLAIAVDNSGVFGQQGDVYVSDFLSPQTSNSSLITKFNSEGAVLSSWGNNSEGWSRNGPPNGQLNGSNAPGPLHGPFKLIEGLAVDPSGNLWVHSEIGGVGIVFEFRSNSSFVTSWEGEYGDIAVDAEDNLYMGRYYVREYKLEGVEIGQVTGVHSPSQYGLTVDPGSRELYLSSEKEIERFDASCHPHTVENVIIPCVPVETFGTNNIGGTANLAIDSSTNTLYAVVEQPSRVLSFSLLTVPDVVTVKATGFAAGTAVLNGSVDPSGVELNAGLAGCRFEWGEHGSGENEPYGHTAPCDKTAAQIGSGNGPVEVHANISGLQQGHTYHFRLVAGNHNQVNGLIDEPSLGSDLTSGPPLIEKESVIAVGADSATVQAQVDPHNIDTRIRVEYGTQPGVYDHSTSGLDLGAGGEGQLASVQLTGLEAASTYHYRVVAESVLGEGPDAVIGADRVFTTQSRIVGAVPVDGRVWELVSPPDKRGADPAGITESGVAVQAAATGDAMTYGVSAPAEAEPPGYPDGVQELSRRTSEGWQSQNTGIPHDKGSGASVGYGHEYRFFSTDLSLGIVQPFGAFNPRVSPEASEQTPYLATNFPAGSVGPPCLGECFRPLVTGAAGYENVPAETPFAQACEAEHGLICGPVFVGASRDLSHVVLRSAVPLVEGAPAGREEAEASLYEWSNGKLSLVSVLPNEQPQRGGATFGGNAGAVTRGAISINGSRVVWSEGEGRLFVRDTVKGKTVQVGGNGVQFQFASSDGSKIVYIEKDLHECEIVEENGVLRCETRDLTPAGGVIGTIPGASEDASYVYFVANGVLQNNGVPVAGAQPGKCEESTEAGVTCNLYVYHDGVIKLVAELSSEDGTDWDSNLSELTARVSLDGRWLAFMSVRSVTGYDNRDAVSGVPDTEVYLYDANGNNGEGTVVCASCNPTGARPHGSFEPEQRGYPWKDGTVPGWTPFRLGVSLYQSRYLSDSGRLFFESTDALVPQDSNGARDVYEYEPPGVGDCATANAGYVEGSGGCVGLISSGTSGEQSVFMDASENGSDVFFLTTSQLARADNDEGYDVYDARVDGGFPERSPGPVCEGDACQSPFGAPEDSTPGSLTYSGPGNPGVPVSTIVTKGKGGSLTRAKRLAKALAVCRRDRSKRVRERCVVRAHKLYGQTKNGKAGAKRGRR